jgi:RimJ/RimL family protein N-acetyltransferase
MYAQFGFGLYAVELRESGIPIGICGLIKRDALEDVDLGFAFLAQFRSQGFALEAAVATLEYGRQELGLSRIVAVVAPKNTASIRLLEKLGMKLERKAQLTDGAEEVCIFGPAELQPLASGAEHLPPPPNLLRFAVREAEPANLRSRSPEPADSGRCL